MGGNYRGNRGNQRNNFRGRGRGRGFNKGFQSGGRNDRDQQNKGQWHTNERLSEPAAGITQYISSTPGFQGIIKSR